MLGLTVLDAYRVALLFELAVFEICYGWALWRYIRQVSGIEDPALRSTRAGVRDRTIGIELILLLFTAAVAARFGTDNAGNLVFNLWLQVALVFWASAWIRVDRRRFLSVERDLERSDAAGMALERLAEAADRQERKARARRKGL